MPIVPHAELSAMSGMQTKAITTTITKADTLFQDGYKMRREVVHGRVIIIVQGEPTEHKNRETGKAYLKAHGPYRVDVKAMTCTCEGFANMSGVCKHLKAAISWNLAWERGESPTINLVSISRELIALKEVEGERFHCQERRIVVFRDWTAAGAYWAASSEINAITEPVELRSIELEELAAKNRYAGLLLQTPDGGQPIPLPEVDWSARAARGRAAKRSFGASQREDFD